MRQYTKIIVGVVSTVFFTFSIYANEKLPHFSPSDLDPTVREQIAEFANGDAKVRSSLFVKLQHSLPSAFEPNNWRIDWDRLPYRVTPTDIKELFGEPDVYFSLNDRPQSIIGLPPKGTDLSRYVVYIYKGNCAERHYSVMIKGSEHHSEGYLCDVLRFQFYKDTLIDLVAAELPPDMITPQP
ncbi:MAG: hypothetical protein WBR29_06425 [Gammaproteobacteria bacterium]